MLKISGLKKGFGGQLLFRGAEWFVGPEERLALVGANGTGKSTLLKIAAGLETCDAGAISAPKDLLAGYLAQTGFVLEEGTVREEARRGFDEILALQAELVSVEDRMADPAAADDTAIEKLAYRQTEILDRLGILGAHDMDRQIHGVLTGLGFEESQFDRPVNTLSGGWQMRAALARILLQRPELLLLDEPTNHLDLEAREWLEGYLQSYPYACVLVSHDRYFLDVTVKRVTEITNYRLEEYPGNYSFFEAERAKRMETRQAAYERQQDEIKRITRFIERFRYKNTKAVQVQSRIKYLERMEKLEPPQAPTRGMILPIPPAPRSGRVFLELQGVCKAYGDTVVLEDVDLRLERGKRIALVGPNGAGKSTLMRILAAVEPPDEGERRPGHNLLPAFFAQDHGDQINPQITVLESVEELAPFDFVPRVRSLLGAFLFSGEAVDKKVRVLSGGERNRLALARLLVRPSNVLLLDEPTNHLDIPSKDMLLGALEKYPGTVVFVSHDRHFLSALADHVLEVGDRTVREFPGDYESFLWQRDRREQQRPGSAPAAPRPSDRTEPDRGPAPIRGEQPAFRARSANERKRLAKRLVEIEQGIAQKEAQKKRLGEVMNRPDFFANRERAGVYIKQLGDLGDELAALYREWEACAEDGGEASP